MYKCLSFAAVIVWMALIFYLSHQPGTVSNDLSTGITKIFVYIGEKMAPHMEFDLKSFNHIIRKSAHFFVYFVLGLLVMNALRSSAISGYKGLGLAIVVCVLYAISDEVHQLFVAGRGAQVKDVLIDSAGAMVGISVYLLCAKIFLLEV